MSGGWGGRAWVLGVYAFLYVPILCLIVFSFTAGEITTRLDGLSLRWYAALARDTELHAAVLLSLRVGALAATAVTTPAHASVLFQFIDHPFPLPARNE